jgi:lysozyme
VKLSDRGAQLIANFEGFRSCPYRDAVGVWTIGYGSTKGVGPGSKCISRAQALARMKREVGETYGKAVDNLPVELNQNQFDALTSFVYNVGPGGIASSTGVGRALRARQWHKAADELLRWNKAGGQELAGLTRRRREERELFLEKAEPEPIKWSDKERQLVRVLNDPDASKQRKDRARATLKEQAGRIQEAARRKGGGGWDRYDRGRRFRGIRRLLEGKPAKWW